MPRPDLNESSSSSLRRKLLGSTWEQNPSPASSSDPPDYLNPAEPFKRRSGRPVRSAGRSAASDSRSTGSTQAWPADPRGPWQEGLTFGEGSSGTGARPQATGQTGEPSGNTARGNPDQAPTWTTSPEHASDIRGDPSHMYGNVELPGEASGPQTGEADYAQAFAMYGQIRNAIPFIQNAATASNTSGHTFLSLIDMAQSGVDIISGQSSKPPVTGAPSLRKSSPDMQGGDEKAKTTKCLGCGATATPEWRRGPMGPRTLCNACGLVHIKLQRKRKKQEEKAAAAKLKAGEASKS